MSCVKSNLESFVGNEEAIHSPNCAVPSKHVNRITITLAPLECVLVVLAC